MRLNGLRTFPENSLGHTAAAENDENCRAQELSGELLQNLHLRPGHVRLHDLNQSEIWNTLVEI